MINVTGIAMVMFAITAVPVMIGILFRFVMPEISDRIEDKVFGLATVLFILVVLGALLSNWGLFLENVTTLGPLLMALNALLLALGGSGGAAVEPVRWRCALYFSRNGGAERGARHHGGRTDCA